VALALCQSPLACISVACLSVCRLVPIAQRHLLCVLLTLPSPFSSYLRVRVRVCKCVCARVCEWVRGCGGVGEQQARLHPLPGAIPRSFLRLCLWSDNKILGSEVSHVSGFRV
jgi:hypothetical protein